MDRAGGAAHLVTLTCSPSTGTAVTSLASRAVLAPALKAMPFSWGTSEQAENKTKDLI